MFLRLGFFLLLFLSAAAMPVSASITFQHVPLDDDETLLVLEGEFSSDDDLNKFVREVKVHNVTLVAFNSNGGNLGKAMDYGRKIRALGLNTLQIRSSQCASACALAFVGGVYRIAEPGAIGVHQSWFPKEHQLDSPEAVAAVQAVTAEVMAYLNEMDVDLKLLQLSLSTGSKDMRYLTAQEMENLRVTNPPPGFFDDDDDDDEEEESEEAAFPARASPEQSTASNVPVASEDTSELSREEQALMVATAFHLAWSHPLTAHFAKVRDYGYGDVVLYHGNFTERAEVFQDKRNYAKRWPIQLYSLKHGSERIDCGEQACTIIAKVEWFSQNSSGSRRTAGVVESTLIWNFVDDEIIAEAGKIITSDKKVTRPERIISQWRQAVLGCAKPDDSSAPSYPWNACVQGQALEILLDSASWCEKKGVWNACPPEPAPPSGEDFKPAKGQGTRPQLSRSADNPKQNKAQKPATQFRRIQLAHGITLDAPSDWWVISETVDKITVKVTEMAFDQAGLDVAGFDDMPTTLLSMNATPEPTGAMVRIGITLNSEITQSMLSAIYELDPITFAREFKELRESARENLKNMERGLLRKVRETKPLNVERIGSNYTLVHSYTRQGINDPTELWEVSDYQIPVKGNLVWLTLSHRLSDAHLWTPALERVKRSLKF